MGKVSPERAEQQAWFMVWIPWSRKLGDAKGCGFCPWRECGHYKMGEEILDGFIEETRYFLYLSSLEPFIFITLSLLVELNIGRLRC